MGDIKHYHSKTQKQNAKILRNNLADAEKILWQYLKNSQFKNLKFRRQQPIGKYIVDFLCCSEKLIIELDGGQHSENIEYDKERDIFLENEGYRVIRIWNNDIFCNIDGVFDYLNNIIEHPPLTPPLKGGENNIPKSCEDLNKLNSPNALERRGVSSTKSLATQNSPVLERRGVSSTKLLTTQNSPALEGRNVSSTKLLTTQNSPALEGRGVSSTKSLATQNSPALEGRGSGGGCKIQCPAKINLTLKILNKREDGFHNIESIMQTINLFDFLTMTVTPATQNEINLSGTSSKIPYNEKNLVYKAAKLFLENVNLSPHKIDIFIEKNIPVAAGLAGGSTDAAGTIFGLNEIFNRPLTKEKLHELCTQLGSDLNFCLEGGKQLTKGRGEILEPLKFEEFSLSLIKPKILGISAKEAYTKFAQKLLILHDDKIYNNVLSPSERVRERVLFLNDLEWAIIDDYPELQKIKTLYPNSMMSGSGSTYFVINESFNELDGYQVFNNLKAIPYGVTIKKDP